MTSIAYSPVSIQTSSQAVPATPAWFGEVVLLSHYLGVQGVLAAISEQVRFARRRFGHYEVIDFVAVLFGYAISGEHTLETFYEHLRPFASAFMALFGRERLPARSTLSRFLADLLARPLGKEQEGQSAGLWDRQGSRLSRLRYRWHARGCPPTGFATDAGSAPDPRGVCARSAPRATRDANVGKSCARAPRCCKPIRISGSAPLEMLGMASIGKNCGGQSGLSRPICTRTIFRRNGRLSRLDGQYGTGAVFADLAGLPFVLRGKDYQLLDRPEIQVRLHLPPDQQFSHPESPLVRTLYDCPQVPIGPSRASCRVVVATHPAGKTKSPVGVERDGIVYELFFTKLPQSAFTAADVVALYLHRGAEDQCACR